MGIEITIGADDSRVSRAMAVISNRRKLANAKRKKKPAKATTVKRDEHGVAIGWTVGELIQHLGEFDPSLPVSAVRLNSDYESWGYAIVDAYVQRCPSEREGEEVALRLLAEYEGQDNDISDIKGHPA